MAITPRQFGSNSVGSGQSRVCQVAMQQATLPGSLVFITVQVSSATANLSKPFDVNGNDLGFTLIGARAIGDLKFVAFYRENCPSMSSYYVATDQDRALLSQYGEYPGVAQFNALDSFSIRTAADAYAYAGQVVNTQADSLVIAGTANLYASTYQQSFDGALTQLINAVTPQSGWGFLGLSQDPDYLRSRLTWHQTITTSIQNLVFAAILSAFRPWISFICVFKGGSSGPAKMTSKNQNTPMLRLNPDSTQRTPLTVFGRLSSGITSAATPMLKLNASPGVARIGPSNYQYRLGGWSGLLIGENTPYQVDKVSGLQGWDVETSDVKLPRNDGDRRGTDLQSAKTVIFEIRIGTDLAGVPQQQLDVEGLMENLRRALIPQRDADWELIWRYPGQALRLMYVRPTSMPRDLDPQATTIAPIKFALQAADPRMYSVSERKITVPVTPLGVSTPVPKNCLNLGNTDAYPLIRLIGPPASYGAPVTRVQLTNTTADSSFAVNTIIPAGATLLGDMKGSIINSGVSPVTINGQTKFAAWEAPREEFYLQPGANLVTLQTTPAGAPVTCVLEYRDTSAG